MNNPSLSCQCSRQLISVHPECDGSYCNYCIEAASVWRVGWPCLYSCGRNNMYFYYSQLSRRVTNIFHSITITLTGFVNVPPNKTQNTCPLLVIYGNECLHTCAHRHCHNAHQADPNAAKQIHVAWSPAGDGTKQDRMAEHGRQSFRTTFTSLPHQSVAIHVCFSCTSGTQ